MAAASRSGVFVGREGELALLRGLVTEVAAGRGRAVLVEGEPGIGKSALLAAGLGDAGRLGCEVLWGAADELGQRFPLQVMLECLGVELRSPDPRRAEIARSVRGDVAGAASVAVAGAGAGDPVVAAVERLLALVDVLCSAAPVLLAVDDLQWADEASLLVWHRLSRAVQQLPLLLVGACRPVPRREELERLRRGLRARDAVVISLGPLPANDVSVLVSRLVGAPPGPMLRRRAERAAGNPLYLREMVDALLREEAVRVQAGVAEVVRPASVAPGPTSLSAAIADRLGFLSRESREALRAATLLGAEFSVTDLGLVVRRPASELVGVVEEAAASGVVEAAGPLLRFRHAMIRQAVYESMPAAVRSALHRQAAQALAEAGAPAERVAQQLLPVVEAQDAWMLDWLARSAPWLVYRAPQIAAELLERVIEQAPAEDPRREPLEACLATATFLLARHEQIERHSRQVLARTRDPERAAEMTWVLAYTLMRIGRYDEGLLAVRQALDTARLSAVWTARLHALEALIHTSSGRYGEAETSAAAALAEGERVDDRFAIGYALHVHSVLPGPRRDSERAVAYVERALTVLGDDPQTADLRIVLLINNSLYLGELGRTAEADASVRRARVLAERTGTARIGNIHVMAAQLYYLTGRWDDAQAELEAVTDLPETQFLPLSQHGFAALIAGHRDDRAAANAHSTAVPYSQVSAIPAGVRPHATQLLMAWALIAERDGRPADALAVLAPTVEAEYADQLLDRYLWLPQLTRLALAVGDPATAGAAARVCADDAARDTSADKTAAAAHCRGLLIADPAPLLAAADHYRKASHPLELGQALEDAAVLLAGAGDIDAARTAHAEAVEAYTGLGAEWDILRADSRTRPLGIRRGPRGPRRRATSGWDALSPTEVKIAQLVAQGRSNPEIGAQLFLSRRTVQTHVSHIMTKLDVHSRTEVAREAALHPAGGEEPAAVGKIS